MELKVECDCGAETLPANAVECFDFASLGMCYFYTCFNRGIKSIVSPLVVTD